MLFSTHNKTKLQFSNMKRKQVFYEDDQTLSKNVEFVGNSAVFRPRNSSNQRTNFHFKLSPIGPHNCFRTKTHFSNVNFCLKKKREKTCNLSRSPQIQIFVKIRPYILQYTYMIKGTDINHSYFVICVASPEENIFL